MRHNRKINHLGRKSAHRKAMLANMACSLIEHKRVNTTVAKAKALRIFVEPLLTKSKTDSTHSRRTVFSYLRQKEAVSELFRDVAPLISDRPGGYTRIIRTGNRLGDNAEMCLIELVDFNEVYTTDKKTAKKSRRSRRGGSGSAKAAPGTQDAVAEEAEVVEETVEASAETAVEEPTAEEPKAEVSAKTSEESPEANDNEKSEEDKAE